MDLFIKKYLGPAILLTIWVEILGLNLMRSYPTQLAMGYLLLFASLAWILADKTTPLIGLSYFYFALTSIPRFAFPQEIWAGLDLATIAGFQALIGESLLYITLIAFVFAYLNDEAMAFVGRFFIMAGIFTSIILYVNKIAGKDLFFLFNNTAIDVAFLSCLIPSIFTATKKYLSPKLHWLATLLFCAPCIFTMTSTGILGLGLAFVFLLWGELSFSKKYFPLALSVLGAVVGLGVLLQGEVLFNSSGRFGIWKMAFNFWKDNVNVAYGTGLGTYQMWGIWLQLQNIPEGQTNFPGFFWMHNDWLQILFEIGIAGFVLTFLVYATALWNARKNLSVFASLALYGSIAIIQMPLRHLLFACLGAYFLRLAIQVPRSIFREELK